jgi:hypothetical protein
MKAKNKIRKHKVMELFLVYHNLNNKKKLSKLKKIKKNKQSQQIINKEYLKLK